jgi:hypothetical protein
MHLWACVVALVVPTTLCGAVGMVVPRWWRLKWCRGAELHCALILLHTRLHPSVGVSACYVGAITADLYRAVHATCVPPSAATTAQCMHLGAFASPLPVAWDLCVEFAPAAVHYAVPTLRTLSKVGACCALQWIRLADNVILLKLCVVSRQGVLLLVSKHSCRVVRVPLAHHWLWRW